jgi:hypothetical protein
MTTGHFLQDDVLLHFGGMYFVKGQIASLKQTICEYVFIVQSFVLKPPPKIYHNAKGFIASVGLV